MREAALLLAGGAGALLLRMTRQEASPDRVVCLGYHRLAPFTVWDTYRGTERRFSIPLERFTAQLDSLTARGWRFVSLDEVVAHARGERSLPARTALITFDDGCESVHRYALPALRERGIPAVVFVTVGEDAWIFGVGTEHGERRMTPDELRACAEAGIAIGSHGVSHRGLAGMTRDEALAELRTSRSRLEEWVGRPVRTFSIPLNFHDRRVRALCVEAGYEATFVSDPGAVLVGVGTGRIRRLVVEGGAGLPEFLRSLEPWPMVRRRIVSFAKRVPPRLLGERVWMPLRARLLRSKAAPLLNGRGLAIAGAAALATLLALRMGREET